MRVDELRLGPLETNCFIVSDGLGGPLVVIDPGGDPELLLEALSGAEVSAVVLTHGHFDHLGAAVDVIEATGAPLVVHELDAERIISPDANGTGGAIFGYNDHVPAGADRTVRDGDELVAGQLTLKVLHTPGHTQGGMSLFAADPEGGVPHLFSGDTLFAGSVGRSDFPGGDSRTLAASIAGKLAPLPAETIVHPGHGPNTTIGRERRVNPFWPRA